MLESVNDVAIEVEALRMLYNVTKANNPQDYKKLTMIQVLIEEKEIKLGLNRID